ncbi:MAG: 6-carboxytetrahydropterin synthase [Actinomycetota bacterium]|nr:6-carboxytetrahydropterin synthase [Actinomycetota bacterium]
MPPRRSFKVTVTKDYLVFASAHFITFAGHRCEPLHGHNYRVAVTLEGGLDEESWYVVDFSVLKGVMRRLCDEIDHKVLLPTANPRIAITTSERSVTVALDGEPKYAFPPEDCAFLPITNTTVEMMAQHLAGRVREEMTAAGARRLTAIELELEENFGQSAVFREEFGADET